MCCRRCWFILLLILFPVAVNAADIGDTLFVCSQNLPAHEAPTAFSASPFMLHFGEQVVIKSVVTVAGQDEKAAKKRAKQKRELAWVKVDAGGKEGYVPERCLVSRNMLNRQDPNKAAAKSEARGTDKAGKGFSETESGDLNTVKGVTSGAKSSGSADHAGIDNILSAPAEANPYVTYESFRRDGHLAEFAGKKE